jgi:hypothetical protein
MRLLMLLILQVAVHHSTPLQFRCVCISSESAEDILTALTIRTVAAHPHLLLLLWHPHAGLRDS